MGGIIILKYARMDKFFQNKLFVRIGHLIFFFAFIVIVCAGMRQVYPMFVRAQELNAKRDHIQRLIEDKKREISELKARQQRFNMDRAFVESLARKDRRVRPNEVLFVFQD